MAPWVGSHFVRGEESGDLPEKSVGEYTCYRAAALGGVSRQRWDWVRLARLMLFAAVGVLVVALIRIRAQGLIAWLTLVIPGVAVLLAAPSFGAMPRAAEDAR